MAALVNALDNYTPSQFGENGHAEYGWSNSIQEKILQFSFQVVRTNEFGVQKLQIVLKDLLATLKHRVQSASLPEKELAKGYLSVLYRMIGHTRDIIDGKGEYMLTYMMIHTWYEFYPELSKFALRCLVDLGDKSVHQYGSWKDIKYFCEYARNHGMNIDHPLIRYAVVLTNEQLKKDYENLSNNSNNISLTAKWVPREKSSFSWLYQSLATNYFSNFLETARTETQMEKAILKCKTEYRKVLSSLNRKIDTLQIKQCDGSWSAIDFNKVTSISLAKQKQAFLNIKKDRTVRYPDNQDRIECAEHFKARIKKAVDGEVEMKGKRVGMADFTKQAIDLLRHPNADEINLLNSQWRDNGTQNGALGKMIAMVDVSGSMEGDPMNVGIALGIRISEKSVLGKRVMTFSSTPTWVNLEGHNDFVSQVQVLKRAPWGMNTNFHAALDMILDAIIQNKMTPEEVQDMVLVILSDMQMDAGDACDKKALYDFMKAKYEAAGIRVHGRAYKPPHILFWNLRSTSGFPSLSTQPNASMMSGFSPVLLNLFCEQGMEALQSCTPWALLEKSLENDRYKIMSDKLSQEIEV
jgi:hypothetical protein